jgi:hypothetical protein
MKTYKLIIKINSKNEIEDIKETIIFDQDCLEVDGMELTDFMDVEAKSLLEGVRDIGIA